MPKPIKHSEMVRRLRPLGWQGPFQKGKHPFMVEGETRLTIPNPHRGDLDWSLVKKIIKSAGITSVEWESVK